MLLPNPATSRKGTSAAVGGAPPATTTHGTTRTIPISITQPRTTRAPSSRLARAEASVAAAKQQAAPKPPRSASIAAQDAVFRGTGERADPLQSRTLVPDAGGVRGVDRGRASAINPAFRLVVRWIATILVATGCGGVASAAGGAPLAAIVGGVLLFAGGVFVGATVCAAYLVLLLLPAHAGDDQDTVATDDELLSPGMFHAATLGFIGVGLALGALAPVGWHLAIASTAGLVALVLTAEPRSV